MRYTVSMEVHQAKADNVYRDRARIPEPFRGGIQEGRICKLSVGGKSALLEIRGLQSTPPKPIIRLDERTRLALDVPLGDRCEFTLRPVWWIGQWWWAWNASDPTSRIAARLGVLGLLLGFFGLLAAIIPLLGDLALRH